VVLSEAGILDVPAVLTRINQSMPPEAQTGEFVPLHAMVEDVERRHIGSALKRTGGSVMKTAELLGISRKTLWEKMKKLKVASDKVNDTGHA
jgi:DNA-binding NtrC family response regulator